ncbi:MAG: DNA repair protein RecN [Candidatus Aminicenantes bacterium]|nr:DNA repair protein RecN [Candidatus Aminicenantes bacterium]
MLSYLKVENLAVVEKATLDFSPNLNILTGETGAGKSILIDAIMLLINKKPPANIVRSGADKLTVEALFVQHDEEIILKREIARNKSLTYINGELAPFAQVKEKAEALLNIYGQKDHAFLLNTANHQVFLDQFAEAGETLKALAEKCRLLRALQAKRNELLAKNSQAREKIDYLNFQLQEIETLNLQKGDDALWQERLKILAAAESILEKSDKLIQDFYQKDQSVYNLLAQALPAADYLQSLFPEFGHLKSEIDRFYNSLPEISEFLNTMAGKVDFNEGELNDISEKLSRLEKLKAKHKLGLEPLLEKYEHMRRERDELLNLNFSLSDVEKEMARELAEYKTLLEGLRQSRRKSAARLSAVIVKELAFLEMAKARFEVRIDENEPSAESISENGPDKIEFYFSSNPGQAPGRLKDVASGGELSRLMLVLKSISSDESGTTFIFDEIDSGIGGKTAEFVGEKLRRISAQNQVISISHLPQIARFADRHFLISKEFKNNQTFSTAVPLEDGERVREIARLMAGSAINADVLKAAELLLASSRT